MLKKLCAVAALAIAVFAVARVGASSGLEVGDMVTPFHPTHLSGPDKGTDACPPCTYGNRPAVQAWFHGEDPENVAAIAKAVNSAVGKSDKELKGFMIMLTMCDGCVNQAKAIAKNTPFNKIAIATLPTTDGAVKNYKYNLDSEVKNTVLVYKNKRVVAKFVNLKGDAKGIAQLQAAIAKAEAN